MNPRITSTQVTAATATGKHLLEMTSAGKVAALLLLTALLILLCLTGCRKEEDDWPPEIEIFTPKEHEVYTTGDSIFVSGRVKDETQIVSVVVVLTDHQFIIKDHQVNVSVAGNPFEFGFWYQLTNRHLPDGDYNIQVRAFDGVNTKYKYRKIRLVRGPRDLQSVVVVTRNGDHSFSLSSIDTSSLDLVQQRQWMHAYAGSGIVEQENHIMVLGQPIGACYAVDLNNFLTRFQVTSTGAPSEHYYENLLVTYNRFYTGLLDGYVKGYNHAGSQQFVAELSHGRKPAMMAIHASQFMVMVEKEVVGNGVWLTSTFLESGLPWSSYKLPDGFEPVSIITLNNDEVMVAGNFHGAGRLVVWNIYQNSITTPWQHISEVYDAIRFGSARFLLATQDEVLVYQLHQSQPVPFLPHQGGRLLKMDPGSPILYIGNSQSITAYHTDNHQQLWHLNLPETLADFHLHYQ